MPTQPPPPARDPLTCWLPTPVSPQILKPQYPGAELPPKYALELLTIYTWEQGANSNEAFKLAEGFCTVLKLLGQYRDICIYWERYYSLQHHRIGAHLKQLLRMPW